MLRTPLMDGPSYVELEPEHPLYGLAAWAYHHARRLSPELRRGLLVALEAAWPRTQGDRKEREHRALMMWHANRDNGGSIERVAEQFHVAVDTARRYVREVERELRWERFEWPGEGTPNSGEEWRVDVVWPEAGEEPADPADPLAYMKTLAASPEQAERQLDDRQRAIAAGAQLPGPMRIEK